MLIGVVDSKIREIESVDGEGEFLDDVSGVPLDNKGVRKARREEIEEFRKHEVYVHVLIKECYDSTGK